MENRKHALITGATAGIGLELARLFARDGYTLTIVARTAEDLQRTARELRSDYGVEVRTIARDLMLPEGPFDVCREVDAAGIPVDVLVNDAGQGLYGEFTETDIRRELDIIRLNIDAYLVLGKHFLQQMVGRGSGRVLNVASIASRLPGPLQSVYHASKAFVLSWSEAIRFEVKDKGVTVTALMPGPTDTDFFRKADMESSKLVQEGSMSDPAAVARDGYEALMAGEDKVISGMKNKLQVGMSNMMPDPALAAQIYQQSKPAEGGQE